MVVIIQVLFKDLKVFIDVLFLFLKEDVPTLLLINDMIDNSLYISILSRYVRLGQVRHTLIMEKIFDTKMKT